VHDTVVDLQRALTEGGFCNCTTNPNRNECADDGIVGQCTLDAVERFATTEDLWHGDDFVTIEVLEKLHVKY